MKVKSGFPPEGVDVTLSTSQVSCSWFSHVFLLLLIGLSKETGLCITTRPDPTCYTSPFISPVSHLHLSCLSNKASYQSCLL